MNKNKIKPKSGPFIINFEKNIIGFPKNLLLIKMLLLISINSNLILSLSINKKRNIILQSSSIKLKIEKSRNQKIYSNKTYSTCESVIIPDEIYINGENQTEIKNDFFMYIFQKREYCKIKITKALILIETLLLMFMQLNLI